MENISRVGILMGELECTAPIRGALRFNNLRREQRLHSDAQSQHQPPEYRNRRNFDVDRNNSREKKNPREGGARSQLRRGYRRRREDKSPNKYSRDIDRDKWSRSLKSHDNPSTRYKDSYAARPDHMDSVNGEMRNDFAF